MNDQNRDYLINKSLDLLVDIQNAEIKGIPTLSIVNLKDQMSKFKHLFCEKFLDICVDGSVEDAQKKTVTLILSEEILF